MSLKNGHMVSSQEYSQYIPMTSGEKLEAVYNILTEIQAKYIYVSDFNGIDLAFIISDFGYELVRRSTIT